MCVLCLWFVAALSFPHSVLNNVVSARQKDPEKKLYKGLAVLWLKLCDVTNHLEGKYMIGWHDQAW